jgi:hypothetical protein
MIPDTITLLRPRTGALRSTSDAARKKKLLPVGAIHCAKRGVAGWLDCFGLDLLCFGSVRHFVSFCA